MVRVRDHLVVSSAAAVLLAPWLGRRTAGFLAGSVFIDADHYVWFSLRQRRLNPVAAVRFFNAAEPPQHSATRLLHTPVAVATVLSVGIHRQRLLPVAIGMALHVALDAHHRARMDAARTAALKRDGFSCQACGTQAPPVGAHVWRQPWLLPSYGAHNLISLCARCHAFAHTRAMGASSWT